MKKEFITIEIVGEYLLLEQFKGTKSISKHNIDIINNNAQKELFCALMKHNEDLPIVISWKDLRFLRRIGIRV